MQIILPDEAVQLAKTQALAAGFSNVGEYVANLITNHSARPVPGTSDSARIVERFREYRGMLNGTTIEKIVESRHKGLL